MFLPDEIGVVVFPGSGVTDNLADKARNLGIPLFDFGSTGLHIGCASTGLFNALYKPLYERLMLGSIAAIQSASAILVTPFARAMLSA